MKKLVRGCERLAMAVMVCWAWGSIAWPYEAGEVANGGTITGKVTLRGPIPEPRVFPMVLYPFGDFCKKISNGEGLVLLREFNVDGAGGLQDAVVAVQGVPRGKAFRSRDTELVTMNCMFHPADVPEGEQFEVHEGRLVHVHPLLTVMRNHTLLSVANRDPVDHAAQVYQPEKGNRVLSFPIPVSFKKAASGVVDLEEGRQIAQIICEMHEYMQTWTWVVDNPYFAKTRKGGAFTIEKLPPGTYKVTAWHPHMKPIEKSVTVPPDGTVSLDFEFDARQVVRPIYETQDQFRIPPERDPTADLKGCEGPFCVRREHEHH
ncbi:MAG: carboxypeptidase regulatory-like domain-containing protein [Nitrospirae bacterium]|nr:carboxypeptidase regulatory-like domain-containing protein [Nitrospirota bacterium]